MFNDEKVKVMTVGELIQELTKYGLNTPVFAPDEGSGTLVPVKRIVIANGLIEYIDDTTGKYMRGVGIRTSVVLVDGAIKSKEKTEGEHVICKTPLEGYLTCGTIYKIEKVLTDAGRYSVIDDNGKECHACMDRFL